MSQDIPRTHEMMQSPRIRVHRLWFDDQQALAQRIRLLLIGTSIDHLEHDREDSGEPRWHIDPGGNNWWLHLHPDTNEFHLAYRYGQPDAFWQAIKLVIETLLK